MKIKRLDEANKDLKSEVEFLRRANERYKSEILRSSKTLEPNSKRQAKYIRSPRSTNSAGSVGSRTRFGLGKNSPKVKLMNPVFSKPFPSPTTGWSSALTHRSKTRPFIFPLWKVISVYQTPSDKMLFSGVNHSIKHQRRLDVINDRHFN